MVREKLLVAKKVPEAEQVLNALLSPVLLLDDELRTWYANPAAQQLLGQGVRKLYGSTLPSLFHFCSLDFERLLESLRAGTSFTDNEVVLLAEGSGEQVVAFSAQRMPDGFVLVEMLRLNNQRRLSYELQQQAQQAAARDLVRTLAHEIKNPLGGLRGAAQLLDKALTDPGLGEYTRVIIEQADRLRRLVDGLSGPQQPGARRMDNVHKVAERVVRLVSLELPPSVQLVRDYDPSLPELMHDPYQVEQVLLNIVRNAFEALEAEGGTIVLRTRMALRVTLQGERYRLAVKIDVQDNGPGVPVEIEDTLFYPMVSGRTGGTGLGLSIARDLVEQHGGKIELVSWPGFTVFSVFLPVCK